MTEPNNEEQVIISLTQKLLNCIADADWDVYKELCDESLTAFEPEAKGCLVEGLQFHKFYFDFYGKNPSAFKNTTMSNVHVRLIGKDVAIICYNRLIQKINEKNEPITIITEETRVWEKKENKWKNVHFHRSQN